jgi:quinol monooxygenase YgiN
MSVKVLIKSDTKKSELDSLMPFLEANLPNVRGFSGCLSVTVLLNKESGKMVFDEEWQSIDHHQKYIKFISENGVMAELGSFLKSPPEIEYLERLSI